MNDDNTYFRRRLVGFAALVVFLVLVLVLWWWVAAWLSSYITGDGSSTWIFFVGGPIFLVYVVYRIFEEVRGREKPTAGER